MPWKELITREALNLCAEDAKANAINDFFLSQNYKSDTRHLTKSHGAPRGEKGYQE